MFRVLKHIGSVSCFIFLHWFVLCLRDQRDEIAQPFQKQTAPNERLWNDCGDPFTVYQTLLKRVFVEIIVTRRFWER